jgi:hypothetical protein
MMWTKLFWKKAAERAIKTFAQTLSITLGAGAVNVFSVGWKQAIGVSLGATLLSVLTSVGSAQVTQRDNPSLVK